MESHLESESARLLPKEKKEGSLYAGDNLHPRVEDIEKAESDYKQFETTDSKKPCKCFDPKECMQFGCQFPVVESSEPQEKFDGADPCTHPQCECKGAICIKRYENERLQRYIAQLESDNKLLREEIGEWKSMGLEAANEISRLKKEIERLKLDV